jgi:excisionase family DNA binding protein
MDAKIGPQHLKRLAGVYVRQSSLHQVRDHRASAELQYDLVERAVALGWPREIVRIYDRDQGTTGSIPGRREDFHELVAEVGLGHIGIVLGFDVTRLARNNADWYRLLDLCGVCDTLIADLDGTYDPALYNDRLLLGMKGTMSEAEHHLINMRLQGGLRKRAQTGDLRKRLPVGLDYDDLGKIRLTTDESVHHAIALVFGKFAEFSSAHQVLRHLQHEGLLVPTRLPDEKTVRWIRPCYNAVREILTNPFYAGAYVYGRRRRERTVGPDGHIRVHTRTLPRAEWRGLIPEHHPGYITWAQFEDTQRRLADNVLACSTGEASTVLRPGSALLQGLVRCGVCSRRMRPHYTGPSRSVRYVCDFVSRVQGRGGTCQWVGGLRLQEAVVDAFLTARSPASMPVTLAALNRVDEEEDAVLQQLEHRREQARYEADRARRQYDAVEPENRLVARTLEAEWNRRLTALGEIERQIAEHRRHQPPPLTCAERARLLELGLDLRRIWDTPTTTPQERKQLLRAALDDVVVHVDRASARAQVTLVWQGGTMSELAVPLRRLGDNARTLDESVVDDVRRMAAVMTDIQIAQTLVRRGIRTATGLPYTAERVQRLRKRHGIPEHQPTLSDSTAPVYTALQAAKELGLSHFTVLRWLRDGLLVGDQVAPRAPWCIRLGPSVQHLVAGPAPKGWLPPKEAAKALGLGRRTVLHWVQTGRLEAMMAGKGRRPGLRINVATHTYSPQQPLFAQPAAQGDV